MPDKLSQQIGWLVERLVAAKAVACMTGAGVSAESGVPTFRGAGGLWEGMRAEELATPHAFERDPLTVWRFYLWRRKLLMDVKPNPAHHAIAEMETLLPRFDLTTQNVDGLHHLAGSRNVITLHGDIWIDRCTKCDAQKRVDAAAEDTPKCDACGAMTRPGVVWFGEALPEGALEQAARHASEADVMLVVGTSSAVQPAASLADWAKAEGTTIVEINLEPTLLSPRTDATLLGKCGEILPRIVQGIRTAQSSG